jgi:hypothetical protein
MTESPCKNQINRENYKSNETEYPLPLAGEGQGEGAAL